VPAIDGIELRGAEVPHLGGTKRLDVFDESIDRLLGCGTTRRCPRHSWLEAIPRHREECVLSNICDGQRWSVEQPDQRELARCKDYRFGPAARRCLLSTGLLWPCERAGRACSNKAPSRLRGIPDKLRVPPLTRGGQWALFAFLLESCEVVGGGGPGTPCLMRALHARLASRGHRTPDSGALVSH
jgi:hypothetical protein